ncbi:hypothetical protein P389DRAFT_86914 [Cystobasidium minutum MCA 4210]|uniref:uncharacterized protein n=1 Tax=Cystobasidium minutum MCA 4210 TaxID=1397322 RepID=UPI0034CF47AE|eukprot:jgi/Rhomi1/86914/CE86913_223
MLSQSNCKSTKAASSFLRSKESRDEVFFQSYLITLVCAFAKTHHSLFLIFLFKEFSISIHSSGLSKLTLVYLRHSTSTLVYS